MLIPPKYKLTNNILRLLSQIEANKEVVNTILIPAAIELNLRRKSALRSSVFSARIEGNPTYLDEFSRLSLNDKRKVEISNILKAINWVMEKKLEKNISEKEILLLHSIVMKNIDFSGPGKFRNTHEGIFNEAGIVIYHAPPPSLVRGLVNRLLKFINDNKKESVVIRSILAHFVFEKIHPFTDGSGRVGRLLMLLMLKKGGFGFKGILPFEEKIDKRREIYYQALTESEKDVTSYVEYMLEVLQEASDEAKEAVLKKSVPTKEDFLLPRRREILEIIKDHKIVNLDFIERRFAKINERTLRYDLKNLQDAGFIHKLGATRGVYYKPTQ